MRKQVLNMQTLINQNKEEILSNKKEIKRIEKQIDDKHIDYGVGPLANKSINLPRDWHQSLEICFGEKPAAKIVLL